MGGVVLRIDGERLGSAREELAALSKDDAVRALASREPLSMEGQRSRGRRRMTTGAGALGVGAFAVVTKGPPALALGLVVGGSLLVAGARDVLRARRAAARRLVLVTAARHHPWAFWARRWSVDLEDADGHVQRTTVPRHLRDEVMPGAIGVADLHAGWIRAFDVLGEPDVVQRVGRVAWLRDSAESPMTWAIAGVLGVPFAAFVLVRTFAASGRDVVPSSPLERVAVAASAAAVTWTFLVALRNLLYAAAEPPLPRHSAGMQARDDAIAAMLDRARPALRRLAATAPADACPSVAAAVARGEGRVATLVVACEAVDRRGRRRSDSALRFTLEDAAGARSAHVFAGNDPASRAAIRAGKVGWARIERGALVGFDPR